MLRFSENLIIQMTKSCNLKCKYCYENYYKNNNLQHPDINLDRKYIDHETFKQVLDTALYYRCVLGRVEAPLDIHFHGGEVTLIPWEELKKDIEYVLLRKTMFPNLRWCIQSNGTNITEDMAKFFVQQNMTFGLSFDGFGTEARMDHTTAETFINRLRYFYDSFGLRYAVISVLSTENIKTWFTDMLELTDMFDTVGANLLSPPPGQEHLVPSEEDQWEYYYKPVLESFTTKKPLKERELLIVFQNFIEKIVFGKSSFSKTGCFNKLCGHAANMTALDPNLQVYACDKFLENGPYEDRIARTGITTPDFLGLQQILQTSKFYKKMFKEFDRLHCGSCPAEFICPGDCQAFQISKYGEPNLNQVPCNLINKVYQYFYDNWHVMLQNLTVQINIPGDAEITPEARQRIRENNLKVEYDPGNRQIHLIPEENEK